VWKKSYILYKWQRTVRSYSLVIQLYRTVIFLFISFRSFKLINSRSFIMYYSNVGNPRPPTTVWLALIDREGSSYYYLPLIPRVSLFPPPQSAVLCLHVDEGIISLCWKETEIPLKTSLSFYNTNARALSSFIIFQGHFTISHKS